MSNIYYIYAYIRPNGTPYYIGKGKNRRAYERHETIKVPKDNKRIIIMESGLSEIGALALERRYIRWYGRKDLGTGILRNMTDGGDGVTNLSGDIREKITNIHRGNKYRLGQTFSEESRKKIGRAHRGKFISQKTRDKISKTLSGRVLSKETKKKISIAMKKSKLAYHPDPLAR
jgi:hypothetical protein